MKRGQRGFASSTGGAGFGFGAPASGTSLSYLTEPPSFTAVSDPNVIVSLKNVLKKDSITKAKGLEDLIQHAQSHSFDDHGGVEEALLDIWTQIYPRISVDNSRRVRELSHTLQSELLRSARKRMERHVPKIVGPWLAGLYDRDRMVVRAAHDGLSSFLTTPDRLRAFWVKCHPQILEFAIQAIRETQATLSDERSTTAEDAEAKYFRVVTSSLSLVLGLLQTLDDAGLQKFADKYDEYFSEESVWKSITFKDSAVRRSVCQLLFACLDRQLPYGATAKAKQAFVTGGLRTSQAGSALEYVRALTKLTQSDSSFWISGPTDKKPPIVRLQSFISKGSQGSPPSFWEALDQLIAHIPVDALGLEATSKLLASVKAGITNREEPRTNSSYSWKCFADVAKRSIERLHGGAKLSFAQEHLFPLFEKFLFSTSETNAIPTGPNAMSVLVELHLELIQSSSDLIDASAQEWERLGSVFCTNISGSLPEVSKEYKASQTNIGEQGRRWFGLVGEISDHLKGHKTTLPDQTTGPSNRVISQCCTLLESRNMKPFGAAQIIEYALSTSKHLFSGDNGRNLGAFFLAVAEDGLCKIIEAASARYLLSALGIFGSIEGQAKTYETIWRAWVAGILNTSTSRQARNTALAGLVTQEKASFLAQENVALQDTFYTQLLEALDGESNTFDLLDAACVHQALSDDAGRKIVAELVNRLSKQTSQLDLILRLLETIAKSKAQLFTEEQIHTVLVSQLLALSEISDSDVSPKVAAVRSLVDGQAQGKLHVVNIIQSSLERAGPQSLGIRTIVSQAKTAVQSKAASWEGILPSTNIWMGHLVPLLDAPINPSLSITSSIGEMLCLPPPGSPPSAALHLPRDRDGRCVPARMALYTCELIKNDFDHLEIPIQFQIELLYLLGLTAQIASDQITMMSRNGLWLSLDSTITLSEAEEMISSSRHLAQAIVTKSNERIQPATGSCSSSSSIIHGLIDLVMKESRAFSSRGVHSARVLSELVQALSEVHGMPSSMEEQYLTLENLKAKPDSALLAAGLISGLGETAQSSKAVSNFCNRLVSDVAGNTPEDDKTGLNLALLAITAQIYKPGELPVATNRIVFAVKQVASWIQNATVLSPSLSASICRALNVLLPCMKDVYGSHWEMTLQFCTSLWNGAAKANLDDALPAIHASLKLVKTLESMKEPNDDLEDALREFSSAKPLGLVELLRLDPGTNSQPLEIVNGILSREVEKIPVSRIPQPEELFSLMASQSRDVQTASFNLLHRKILADQEQKSIEVLLDKTDARLPDELVSLFLDPPTLEKFSDEWLSLFPTSIRGYLLSWKLVFDAYSSSSFKIRNDYTEHLKSEKLIDPLMDFLFDVLGHSAAHPLNLEKENIGPAQICDYDIKSAEAESAEQSLHWLLVHLYYLTLKFIPSLFRTWYMNCRSKQTRIAVGSWTTKYLSPIIIRETLDGIQVWADQQQSSATDEQELIVKVSKLGKEITAGYEVDESQAAIVVKMPPSYPIESVTVSGLSRVVANERKWQSWIMTTQGVITFSNGSIIDGLQVFKRNIMGALKGQSECAICYSIISTDKRTADKRCRTCKNLFHRTCLYKWFETSSQNTCPLCRNTIDYLAADISKRRHD
ncbi:C3HC4 type (RING finger) zinc finger containing protein [Metarhizium album ARSEF 1941]|uniref:E3 ubiquitin-protein ligase listerin n=1 Tax=Metarhizium album (strain ARSEF 1941) TaxID=1081103 RepID=A0A0B2WXV2_METAS|nr:C3HC4 type (RING finger) zinc finger containing protein [Metarhizium album ARSEF 1941]KHN98414.1 C3HC4 type (RING finger) zinc finger containing protein [Metarhizium album ARSEF 1941]